MTSFHCCFYFIVLPFRRRAVFAFFPVKNNHQQRLLECKHLSPERWGNPELLCLWSVTGMHHGKAVNGRDFVKRILNVCVHSTGWFVKFLKAEDSLDNWPLKWILIFFFWILMCEESWKKYIYFTSYPPQFPI